MPLGCILARPPAARWANDRRSPDDRTQPVAKMSKSPKKSGPRPPVQATVSRSPSPTEFDEILSLIEVARQRAFAAVNTALIDLYWSIGEYISRKLESATWGEGVVQQLANHIARKHPDLKGFNQRNLFRMRQFYETYQGDEKLSALLTQLSWTHNLLILSRSKRPEEREFYLQMAIREQWSSRDLERQLNGALFERVVLSPAIVSPPVRQLHQDTASVFKDSYLVEFDLPADHQKRICSGHS